MALFLITLMNLSCSLKGRELLVGWGTISFRKGTLLHRFSSLLTSSSSSSSSSNLVHSRFWKKFLFSVTLNSVLGKVFAAIPIENMSHFSSLLLPCRDVPKSNWHLHIKQQERHPYLHNISIHQQLTLHTYH